MGGLDLTYTIGANRTGYGQSKMMRLWQGGISPGDSRRSPFQDATTLGDVSPTLSFGARNTTEGFFVAAFTALPAQHTYRFWFNMQQHTQI
ncbi:hypothetical protein RU639_000496 [Aspergillus parasiticus]